MEKMARNLAIVIEQKQADKELRKREEHLRLATQGAELGTYTYDFLKGESEWSSGLKALFGLKAEENIFLDSDRVANAVHPDDKAEFLRLMTAANTPGGDGILKMDYRIIRPDGSQHWLRVHGRTEFTGEGATRHAWRVAGVVTDITQNKLAEENLRKSEAKFSQLFNISQVPMAIYELKEMKFVDVNESFVEMSGFKREEVIGKKAPSLLWKDQSSLTEFNEKIRRMGKVKDIETQIYNKVGALKTILLSAEIVKLAGQDYLLTSSVDITSRKEVEEALKESEQKYRILVEKPG